MIDSYRHKGMRRRLLEKLREKGIKDQRVLDAMNQIPRHFFMDKAFEEIAYDDRAFPIGFEQTISQPYTVAFMSELLDLSPGMKVLEVGTGSGYQAAVLSLMGAEVHSIERFAKLSQAAAQMLDKLQIANVQLYSGDGYQGLKDEAPFDRIIVTAGAPYLPEALKTQLKPGGVMVIPIGEGAVQKMHRIVYQAASQWQDTILGDFKFVPMLGGMGDELER